MTTPSGFPSSRGMFGLNGSAKWVGLAIILAAHFAAVVAGFVTMRSDINYLRKDLEMYQSEFRTQIKDIQSDVHDVHKIDALTKTQDEIKTRLHELEKKNGG